MLGLVASLFFALNGVLGAIKGVKNPEWLLKQQGEDPLNVRAFSIEAQSSAVKSLIASKIVSTSVLLGAAAVFAHAQWG